MYQADTIYHIYNHSNNYELIFKTPAHYLYFIRKMRDHLLPIGDILCYCLMPDHFHILFRVNEKGVLDSQLRTFPSLKSANGEPGYMQELSNQLRIMLSSYTKTFNRQTGHRGGLFRSNTKAKPAYLDFTDRAPHLFIDADGTLLPYAPYLRNCFYYIHQNPVKSDLCPTAADWPYSSAADYEGKREGTLCNYELVERLLGVRRVSRPTSFPNSWDEPTDPAARAQNSWDEPTDPAARAQNSWDEPPISWDEPTDPATRASNSWDDYY